MPMSDEDVDELKALIQKARTRTRGADLEGDDEAGMAFGAVVQPKPEDSYFVIELKKGPEAAMRRAKAAAGTKKLTFGRLMVEGKVITLNLMGKPVPGITKNLKKFFLKHGFKFKVVVITSDGEEFEPDAEEDEETLETTAAEDQAIDQTAEAPGQDAQADEAAGDAGEAPADPMAEQWVKVTAALGPHVERFAASGDDRGPAVTKAWDGAVQAAEKGDYKSAMAVAGKLKPIVTAAAPAADQQQPAADNPDAAKWAKLEGPMTDLFQRAVGTNPPNRTKLEAAWAMATEAAEAGDYAKAINVATRLKPALDEAAKGGAQGEIPKDVVAFQKSRILWIDTRKAMMAEMKKLEDEIKKVVGDDPDMADVVNSVSELSGRLSSFDKGLEETLEQITVTPEGEERTKLKSAASQIVQDYMRELESDFFKDVDSNNGFVTISVRGKAVQSLSAINKALAA